MYSFLTKLSILTLTTIGFIVISNTSANAHTTDKPTPIQINEGQISTTITGQLNPNQNEHWYQFNAASWQYTLINIAPLTGTMETANVGVLYMPDGSQDGNKGGIIYQDCLPQTGNYKLRIARNLMATEGRTAGYKVEIIILPKYASESLCEYL
ncbi:MAG: hypothetical protein L0G25_07310 [Psychrobacter sp.]|nr:hypothetical protein [Psychrobacter sp.]